MKFLKISTVLVLLAILSFFGIKNLIKENHNNFTEYIPELQKEEEGPGDKNRSWTEEEAKEFYREQQRIQKSFQLAKSNNRASESGLANGNLNGYWESRGPYNMPGAFQFCEMDEGTDTVYAVTCGHYGGAQFIWKGTLWGDDWKTITPKHPARYEDLIVIPKGSKRRVIAGKSLGTIMYSDDAGKNWITPTGLPNEINSTIVNRQDNNIIYAIGKTKLYVSTNNGTSFTEFQDFGANANNSRLYTPRWTAQPGSNDVYLARDSRFYKLNASKTQFTQISTIPTNNEIAISGDGRRLWIVLNGKNWYYSTNGGTSFTAQPTVGYWYNDPTSNFDAGQFIGVNPEDPNILIGGYSVPLVSKNAGVTTLSEGKSYWGYYQNSVGNDPKVRVNYHPDFQSSQFFYDKDGKLMSLRSSDGGMFISYNEWIKTSLPNQSDIADVYYNISLFDQPTQETYRGGFIYGYLNKDHLTAGTQDQGWQDTRENTYGEANLSWDQIRGGDGPCCITGDGKIGWKYNYQGNGEFQRFPLYSGTNYLGQDGSKSTATNFSFTGSSYFTPSVGDWDNGDRIWVLSQSLRRIEYNNGTTTAKEDLFGSGNSYMQGLAQSKVNPDVVYTMRNGIVYKSTNRGTNWSQVANSSATGISGYYNNRGMGWSSPLDQNIVLFATQSGTNVKSIFSTDGGVTWENVTGSGANLFPAAEVNGMAGCKNGKFVFASTNMGPYVFVVDEKKWYPMANEGDVPIFWGQIVYCVDYGDKEIVHFSTWGQGIWDFVIEDIVRENDVAVTQITVPSSLTCGNDFSPIVTIQNKGNAFLNNVILKLYVDNVLSESGTYNTSITKNATQQITLDPISVSGSASLKVVLEMPNGNTDENPLDNELVKQFSVSSAIPQVDLSIVSFSSQEVSGEGANNGRAIHLIDGDNNTFWHAQWTGGGSTMPHEIVIDLGSVYDLSSIGWVNRASNTNGTTKTANISVSTDGIDWEPSQLITIGTSSVEQSIILNSTTGKYVKVVVLSNQNNTDVSSIAELNFYGCENTGVITSNNSVIKSKLSVYPNPASQFITIEGVDLLSIEITNLSGQVVKTILVNNDKQTIDVSGLRNGTYLVRVLSKEGITVNKVIKR